MQITTNWSQSRTKSLCDFHHKKVVPFSLIFVPFRFVFCFYRNLLVQRAQEVVAIYLRISFRIFLFLFSSFLLAFVSFVSEQVIMFYDHSTNIDNTGSGTNIGRSSFQLLFALCVSCNINDAQIWEFPNFSQISIFGKVHS